MLSTKPRILRYFQRRPSVGWIGVDIGSHSIKVAQLEVVGNKHQIAESAVISLPPGAALTGESIKQGWLTAILRNLNRHPRFRGRHAACVLSMNVSEFRSVVIPPGSFKERREMIAQELMETGSSRQYSSEFSFWDCPFAADDSGLPNVNVLSLSSDLAMEVGDAFYQAGLNCHALDGAPFTLARAASLTNPRAGENQPIAVLDWGYHSAHIAVIADGLPVFSRQLSDCGMGRLIAILEQNLELSSDNCRQLLATAGIVSPTIATVERTEFQELIFDSVADPLQHLLIELEKTLAYVTSQSSELMPTAICLMGGGAAIGNVSEVLESEIGIPVTAWHLPRRNNTAGDLGNQPVSVLAQAAALSELGLES